MFPFLPILPNEIYPLFAPVWAACWPAQDAALVCAAEAETGDPGLVEKALGLLGQTMENVALAVFSTGYASGCSGQFIDELLQEDVEALPPFLAGYINGLWYGLVMSDQERAAQMERLLELAPAVGAEMIQRAMLQFFDVAPRLYRVFGK